MPKTKRKAEDEECEILYDECMCNSVSHFYHPIPKYAPPNYTRKTVKVKTETGETEIAIGDRVIYNGCQLSNPESFNYGSLKPGDKVYHIPLVHGGALTTRQTLHGHMRSAYVPQTKSATIVGDENQTAKNIQNPLARSGEPNPESEP